MNLRNLKLAVEAMHECQAEHERTTTVHEMFEGQTVWQGEVQVFTLYGHPKAERAYAWSFEDGSGETHYVAVLEIPPVESPRTAVQAAIASGQTK